MIVLGTPLDRSGLLFDIWEGGIAMDWMRVHVPSTLCPRIPAAFLESERRLLGEAIFRREYLAEFAASAFDRLGIVAMEGCQQGHPGWQPSDGYV